MIFDIQHWNRIYEQSPVGIALVGLDGKWLKVNKTLCNFLKYTELELLSRTFQDITHPEDLKPDLDMLEKVAKGEIDGYEMLKRYISKNGQSVWASLTVGVIKDDDGNPIHYVSHIRPTILPDKVITQAVHSVSFKDFVIDNWQWFISVAVGTIGLITTLSVLLYTTNAKLDIMEKEVEKVVQKLENKNEQNFRKRED